MAIYNLRVEPARGRSAVYRYEYTLRLDNFSWEKNSKYDDFLYAENMNMPSFASDDSKKFWKACEEYERVNANTFRTIDFSLLTELSDEENIELATNFAKKLFGDKFVYSLAVHSKPSSKDNVTNIHCHIMFSERELDGIDRTEYEFFKRYNGKNPENGGCRKNKDWTSFSKLYYIRQTWEQMANDKLREKNLELISSKSLKDQRIDSLAEENYLKAELLDRPPVNLEKKYIDFTADTPERQKAVEFFEYAKKLKEMKEKSFRIKSENFEEENKKAKEKFLQNILVSEGKEYNSSDFDVSQQEREEYFNFENIFLKSIDNNILIDRREYRLKMIKAMTEQDIENRALKIVSKGEYPRNLNRLMELEELYSNLSDKSNFKFKEEKQKLEKYFSNLENDENFKSKVGAMMYKIKEKYKKEEFRIKEDLEFLRQNNFRDLHFENTPQNRVRTQEFYKQTVTYMSDLHIEKQKKDKEVNEYKEYLKKDIKLELYQSIKPESADKYVELLKWKEELENTKSLDDKIELAKRIKSRELGFKNFDIENNIKEKYEKELKARREHYKILRQDQDDIRGKISHSFLLLKELRKINAFDLVEKESLLLENSKNLQTKFDKFEYNIKLSILKEQHKNLFKEEFSAEEIPVKLSENEKQEYRESIVSRIRSLQEELNILVGQLKDKDLTTEELKTRILDKHTNGIYSRYKFEVNYYQNQISKGLSVPENYAMLKQVLQSITQIEKEYKVSTEQLQLEKQVINEANIKVSTQIYSVKEKLKVNHKILKALGKPKIKKVRPKKKSHSVKAGKLKVVNSGRIVINEEEKEREKMMEKWENEL